MEENYNDPVDRLFQEKLSFNETEPSHKVWNKIENELDKADNRTELLRSKKRVFLGLSLTGILLFLNFALKDYSGMGGKSRGILPTVSVAAPEFISNQAGRHRIEARTGAGFADPDLEVNINSLSELTSEIVTPSINNGPINFAFPKKENQSPGIEIGPASIENHSLIGIQPRTRHRLSIEPFFLKEFAGYNFADHDVTGSNGREIEQRQKNMFSASAGFYLNYAIGARWILQTGFVYSLSKSNIDSFSTYAKRWENGTIQFRFNTVSGYSYLDPPSAVAPALGDSIHTNGSSSDLRYVSIPLIISYRIPLKRFSASVGVGSTFNILSSAVVETDVYDAHFVKHEAQIPLRGLKKTNFGLIVKAELAYQVKKHLSFNLMSSFKNTLGPINLTGPVSAYPYNIGLGLGLTWQF